MRIVVLKRSSYKIFMETFVRALLAGAAGIPNDIVTNKLYQLYCLEQRLDVHWFSLNI